MCDSGRTQTCNLFVRSEGLYSVEIQSRVRRVQLYGGNTRGILIAALPDVCYVWRRQESNL